MSKKIATSSGAFKLSSLMSVKDQTSYQDTSCDSKYKYNCDLNGKLQGFTFKACCQGCIHETQCASRDVNTDQQAVTGIICTQCIPYPTGKDLIDIDKGVFLMVL